jgi:alpha-1,3-glucan synthase
MGPSFAVSLCDLVPRRSPLLTPFLDPSSSPAQWFPVESDSTKHMLSQLSKTIKLALKSTEEQRAILRARSGVQRFPVVEWRQRTEDFHRRSIRISRDIAGQMAWSAVDSEGHTGVSQKYADMYPHAPNPGMPGSPLSESEELQQPYGHNSRRGSVTSVATSAGGYDDANSIYGGFEDITPAEPSSPCDIQTYDDFLARANRQIAKESRGTRDPFVEGGDRTPDRPFTINSRVSSVESISSIMDDKGSSSPLNKAIVDFTDANGDVAQDFIQKLQLLSADNSKADLCIEQFLVKSERKYFANVKKEKIISSTASYKSSSRDSTFGTPAPSLHYSYNSYGDRAGSPDAGYDYGSSDHHHQAHGQYDGNMATMANDDGGLHDKYAPDVMMTRIQITMQRQIGKWPLYCIILGAGQMLSATSYQMTLLSGSNYQKDRALYVLSSVRPPARAARKTRVTVD